jgi:hypothetical protein
VPTRSSLYRNSCNEQIGQLGQCSNLRRVTGYTELVHGLLQSLRGNSGIAYPHSGQDRFPVNSSLFIIGIETSCFLLFQSVCAEAIKILAVYCCVSTEAVRTNPSRIMMCLCFASVSCRYTTQHITDAPGFALSTISHFFLFLNTGQMLIVHCFVCIEELNRSFPVLRS